MKAWKGVTILGPSKATIYKIRGKYRWHILVKGKDSGKLHSFVRKLISLTREGSGFRGG